MERLTSRIKLDARRHPEEVDGDIFYQPQITKKFSLGGEKDQDIGFEEARKLLEKGREVTFKAMQVKQWGKGTDDYLEGDKGKIIPRQEKDIKLDNLKDYNNFVLDFLGYDNEDIESCIRR